MVRNYQWTPEILLNNLLEAGCTNKLCPFLYKAMSTSRIQTELGKRVSLFIVLREYRLMKGTDNEAIFSVVCVSDILEQHNIIKRL